MKLGIGNLFLGLCALLASAFASSCSSVKIESGTYPLGVMLPMTGSDSAVSRDVLDGMEMARDEFNAAGGIDGVPLSFVVRDFRAKDFDFAQTMNSLRSAGVRVMSVGFGREVIPYHKTFLECDDIFVNFMCSYAPATVGAKNATRIFINGAQEGDIMAAAVDRSEQTEKQIVIMHADTLADKSDSDYLAFCVNVDKTKLYKDSFADGEKKFDIFSTQIMRLWAQYVFYVGSGRELPAFVDSLARAGYAGAVVADCGFYNGAWAPASDKIPFYRVETLFQQRRINSDISKNFSKKFREKYGRDATWTAAYGYDSVMLLGRAIKSAKFSPDKMREFFVNKEYDGAVGRLKFDSSADSLSEVSLVKRR